MKRAKILYIITGLNVGGAERLLFDTVKNLDGARFEPVVAALVGGELVPEFQESGIRTYDLHMSRRWPFPGVWRLYRVLSQERPHIIHTHLIHADFLGRILGWLCRVPIIITTLHMVEDVRRRFPYHGLDRFAARFNTGLIAVSESIKKELVELEKLDAEKITVIHSGITDFEPIPSQRIQALRASLLLQPDTILIGIVSRLEVPRKGHHILFQALEHSVQQYRDLHCVVIGDGLCKDELQRQVQQASLHTHVTFLGTQHNVPEWLQALDIFVLPSLLEGFPIAIIEAMAAERPIIATRVGGVAELIEDRREGLLIDPNNVPVLEEALQCMIEKPDLRFRLGQAARQRFQEHFEIRSVVEKTQRLYAQQLEMRGFSNRVRLLEVVTNLDPGGVPRHVEDLIKNLPKELFGIDVVSGESNAQRIKPLGVRHHYVGLVKPINPFTDLRAIWQMFWLVRKLKPHIVHSHMSKANFVASVAARCAGVPCVINTVHGRTLLTRNISLKQILFDIIEWMTLRCFGHGTISVSHATTRHLLHWRKVHPSRNVTIHNGIGLASKTVVDRGAVLRRLNIRESQPVILMTGRLAEPKRPEILIEACSLLREQFPDLVCLLAGDGPRRKEIENLADTYHLNNMVYFLGHRDDIQDLLQRADVFVLCSRHEGLSIAVLEAMAAGIPVVASRVPGMEEVVAHNETGYLVTEGSVQECAAALRMLLMNPQKRQSMGEAGHQKFLRQFSLSHQLGQTQALLWVCGQRGFPRNFMFPKDSSMEMERLDPNMTLEGINV